MKVQDLFEASSKVLYHGTTKRALKKIKADGFIEPKISKLSRGPDVDLGPVIWCSKDKNTAAGFADIVLEIDAAGLKQTKVGSYVVVSEPIPVSKILNVISD